ncbi:PilZ domain-containing protein [Grimontia kaedaensis]|uniref:PilZ domain-containing protein n=1 Tax=Grimontia kaedaensis TaxID=2872157 RepID=A0ABY4X0Y7_9GAMM|nr:PilZ domain-containing protein [Grimontia kaedaensis]USH04897.1 PilZ domain-containing protein [Grimontia kaedaensis]
MNDYEKFCDTLIAKSGGENECKRFQARIELGTGGILARLYATSSPMLESEEEGFGHPVVIHDISRSGMALLTMESIDLEANYFLKVVDIPSLKGTLIYCNDQPDGKFRYGFCLDEWLSDEEHQKLSP